MKKTIEYQNVHENRRYKDTLFRMVFKEKEDLLTLYNAVNGTDYQNAEDLQINTLENVLYMGMKNDVSFLIGCTMSLYEHQSSQNENMPLRGLLYLAKLYEAYVSGQELKLYNRKLQMLPTPRYIVFYNGEENEPDEKIQRLSDAFMKEGGCLECEVKLLNINYGHNRELMEKCRRLEEYAIFVARVRTYIKQDSNMKSAITQAMDECVREGVLQDILTKQRAEVLGMVLSTFNKELYEKALKEDAYAEGHEAGYAEGVRQKLREKVRIKLSKGKTTEEIADALEEDIEVVQKLIEEISEDL